MYHYRECGLDNVWLKNGYTVRQTSEGEAVAITDIEGLHRLIARLLVEKRGRLTAKEFRFLRVQLKLSQRVLGEIMGASEQAVARWERNVTQVPETEDRFLRAIYREYTQDNAGIRELVARLNEIEERENAEIELCLEDNDWKRAA